MHLRNINVALRASLFFSAIVVLVVILGWLSALQMGKLRDAEKDVELNWMASIRQTAVIDKNIFRLRLESLRASTTADVALRSSTLASLNEHQKELDKSVIAYEPLIASAEERALYVAVSDQASGYLKELDNFASLMTAGNVTAALELINTTIRPLSDTLQQRLAKLTTFNDEGAAAAGRNVNAIYTQALWTVAGLIAAAIGLTIILATLLTRSITSPLSEALSAAERIAKSDLSRNLVASGTDEAGRLLTALSIMQDNLRQTLSEINSASTHLSSSAQHMSAITQKTSAGITTQLDEVNQAVTAVTQMSAAVDEVARNADSASTESRNAQSFTQTGLDTVAQTLDSIQQLADNVTNTSDQIVVLSNRTQDINKVVEVIRAIAEQTNLLALNAAIEAARAGEQGRGFAVVADEVRALAHRTQQSTQEIEQMIVTVQSDSQQAVAAMKKSTEHAVHSLAVAQQASASLDHIGKAIAHINDRNLQIATASEEQAHVARDVDRNLVNIRDISIENNVDAGESARASGEMAKLAQDLMTLVNRFSMN
jgi:methyl-accepting chemotaxis protein